MFLYFVVNLIVMQYYGVLFPENHYFSAKVVLDQLQYLVTYNITFLLQAESYI